MDELYKIVDHSDVRAKVLTLVLCSSGIREGAKSLLLQNIKVARLSPMQCIVGKLVSTNYFDSTSP
jgi:hypothetical protein